jgi:hypothetical protein
MPFPHRTVALACRLGVALSVAMSVAPSMAPARAVEDFGPPRQVPTLDSHCRLQTIVASTAYTASAPAVRGFGDCDRTDDEGRERHDRLAYAELRPDGWHVRRLDLLGRPLASAHDGRSTYLLYEAHDEAGRLYAGVLERNPHGHYSAQRLTPEDSVGSAAIVAHAGKWWAVWTCVRGGGREYSLCEAGTLFGTTRPRAITAEGAGDFFPQLARRSVGRIDLLWSRVQQTIDGGDYEIRLASTTGHGWHSRQLAQRPNQTLTGDIASDGPHTYAAWIVDGRPVVASDESGRWRTHGFVTRSCARSAAVAVSRGAVIVAVNQCAPNGDDDDESGRAVSVLERRTARWTSRTVAQTPGNGSQAVDVVSRGGRATLLFLTIGWTSYTRTQA